MRFNLQLLWGLFLVLVICSLTQICFSAPQENFSISTLDLVEALNDYRDLGEEMKEKILLELQSLLELYYSCQINNDSECLEDMNSFFNQLDESIVASLEDLLKIRRNQSEKLSTSQISLALGELSK